MKILKMFLPVLIINILLAMYVNADVQYNVDLNPDTQSLCVSGNITECKNSRVLIQIIKPGFGEEQLASVTPLSFTEIFSNIWEIDADENGYFRTPAYILDSESGYYSIYITWEGNESDGMWLNKCFKFVSDEFKTTAVDFVNNGNEDDCIAFVNKNAEIFFDDDCEFLNWNSAKRVRAIKYMFDFRKKFKNYDEFLHEFSRAAFIIGIEDAESAEEALKCYKSFKRYCAFYERFTSLEDIGTSIADNDAKGILFKSGITSSVAPDENLNNLCTQILLLSINSVKNQSQITDILLKNEKYLGINLDSYKALINKKSVNIKIMQYGKINTVSELVEIINDAIKSIASNGSSTAGGGGGGTLSGSLRVKASAEVTHENSVTTNKSDRFVFNDVSDAHWAKEAIYAMAEIGAVNGIGNDLFAPDNFVKREEFTKLIITLFYKNEINDDNDADFSDVASGAWYNRYIVCAKRLKIINGISENKFGTGMDITREDMATIVFRVLNIGNKITSVNKSPFSDEAQISDYARDAVNTLSGLKILNGFDDGEFKPGKNATRAEAVKLLYDIYCFNMSAE